MKLKNQFFLAQLPIIIVLIVTSIAFYVVIQIINDNSRQILSNNYSSIIAYEKLYEELEKLNQHTKSSGIYTQEFILINYNASVATGTGYLEAININTNNRAELELVAELDAEVNDYFAVTKEAILTGIIPRDKHIFIDNFLEQIHEKINELIDINHDTMFFRSDYVDRLSSDLTIMIVVTGLILFLINMIISNIMTNRILIPLEKLLTFTKDIAAGDFHSVLDVSGENEFAVISKEFNNLAAKIKDLNESSKNKYFKADAYLNKLIDVLFNTTLIVEVDTGIITHYNKTLLEFIDHDNSNQVDEYYSYKDLIPELVFAIHNLLKDAKNEQEGFDDNSHIKVAIKSLDKVNELVLFVFPVINKAVGINSLMLRIHGYSSRLENKINEILHINFHIKQTLDEAIMAMYCCIEEKLGEINDKQQNYLSHARELMYVVQNMVNSLIDHVAVEYHYQASAIDLDVVIKECTESIRVLAESKGVKVHFNKTPLNTMVYSNKMLLLLGIKNYLFKFISICKPGQKINIFYHESEGDLKLSVAAPGVILNNNQLDMMTAKYQPLRIDTLDTLGLSVYVGNKLFVALKHRVVISSSVDDGTNFQIHLPKYNS